MFFIDNHNIFTICVCSNVRLYEVCVCVCVPQRRHSPVLSQQIHSERWHRSLLHPQHTLQSVRLVYICFYDFLFIVFFSQYNPKCLFSVLFSYFIYLLRISSHFKLTEKTKVGKPESVMWLAGAVSFCLVQRRISTPALPTSSPDAPDTQGEFYRPPEVSFFFGYLSDLD